MIVRYMGRYRGRGGVTVPGVGPVEFLDTAEVPDDVGASLISQGEFEPVDIPNDDLTDPADVPDAAGNTNPPGGN